MMFLWSIQIPQIIEIYIHWSLSYTGLWKKHKCVPISIWEINLLKILLIF